jgi:hypothetical protein
MKYNPELVEALKHISEIFGWSDEEKREIWELTKDSLDMSRHWIELSASWKSAGR